MIDSKYWEKILSERIEKEINKEISREILNNMGLLEKKCLDYTEKEQFNCIGKKLNKKKTKKNNGNIVAHLPNGTMYRTKNVPSGTVCVPWVIESNGLVGNVCKTGKNKVKTKYATYCPDINGYTKLISTNNMIGI